MSVHYQLTDFDKSKGRVGQGGPFQMTPLDLLFLTVLPTYEQLFVYHYIIKAVNLQIFYLHKYFSDSTSIVWGHIPF